MSHVKTDKLSARTASGTITLGESGETLTVPSGVTLTNNGTASGFGKVLQVVQAVKTDTFSTTSGTFVDVTGLSVNITPSSTSSKILVLVTVWAANNYYTAHIGLFRDSTELGLADAASNRPRSLLDYVADPTMQNSHGQQNCLNAHYLDSPSSTSALTYKIKTARRYDNLNTPTSYINRSIPDRDNSTYDGRKTSIITAMEIAG